MPGSRKLLSALVMTLYAGAMASAASGCSAPSTTVDNFRASGTVLEVLYKVARDSGVCLGVEMAGREIWLSRAELEDVVGPAIELVRGQLRPSAHFEAVERDGVVLIRDRRARGFTLLDYRVEEFAVRRAPVQEVSNALGMTLIRQLRPEVTGFAGNCRPGDLADMAGPFAERNRTVRELLNRLLARSQGGIWLARASTIEEGQLPPEPLWEMIQFSGRTDENLFRLRGLASRYAR